MAQPTRRFRNAAPLADYVGRAVGDALAKRGFASMEIVTHWEEIVGPDLARRSEPAKLMWARREDPDSVGVLQILVEGPYAIEIQHMQSVIIERVNRFFGWRCVGKITIRQGPVTTKRLAPALPFEPEPAAVEKTAKNIGKFDDEALGLSIARLGALIERRKK